MRRSPLRGFSLLELMVVVAIIGIGLTLAVPYFGNASRAAKERSVVAKLLQDFDWARGAAGAGDAGALVTGASGVPVVTMKINDNCTWTTNVTGTTSDPSHSMSLQQLNTLAPGISCVPGSLPKGTQFTFNANGTVSPSGTFTYTGSGTTTWPLQFLFSGTVIRTTGAS